MDGQVEVLLWVLYSDANSRFNTLIEECAHLQDTVTGLFADQGLAQLLLASKQAQRTIVGFDRPVACDPKSHSDYYDASTRDRSFIGLWNSLGGLITGLNSNQLLHQGAYEKLVREFLNGKGKPSESESLYWYLSLRGYFLSAVFLHYTAQLEHAHEKLIQLLENQAGTLPNPILLRRWNSGAYGEFLSEYSRHINWESKAFIELLSREDSRIKQPANEVIGRVETHSLTHTWTHYPTSLTRYFDVHLSFEGSESKRAEQPRRFAIIRSAYFYVEQPVLFPLLYHECVHINFPKSDDVKFDHKSFFGARLAANHSLRLAKFPSAPLVTYENFWDHFTEEVWSDALSVALGGRAYLMSLALQLIGLSGSNEFSHYNIDEDVLYPLNELGTVAQRKYEVPYPQLDQTYFWEARLSIACAVLRRIVLDDQGPSAMLTREVCNSVTELMDYWWKSGAASFDEDGTSTKHQAFWGYRKELNKWVEETIESYLLPVVPLLKKNSMICSTYDVLPRVVTRQIQNAVNSYRKRYFKRGRDPEFSLETATKLEHVAVDVRWAIAQDVVAAVTAEPESLSQWVRAFASWMRHDGGAAFRVALEASRIRLSVLDALADHLDRKLPLPTLEADVSKSRSLDDESLSGLIRKLKVDWIAEDRKSIRSLLRRRGITNSDYVQKNGPEIQKLLRGVNEIVDRTMSGLLSNCAAYESAEASTCAEISIGTLTLGVVRPAEFAEPPKDGGTDSGYLDGMARAEQYIRGATDEQRARAAGDGKYLRSPPAIEATFIKLIGEYQFIAHVEGSTPVERDYHLDEPVPRMLLKPRLALLIGGCRLADGVAKANGQLWGRVAMIRFRYRWQWHDLRRRLDWVQSQPAETRFVERYSLFLSSAWEDVVLVTWHRSPDHFWRFAELGLNIGGSDGVDIQSAYILPDQEYVGGKGHPPCGDDQSPSQLDWHRRLRGWATDDIVSRVYRRSGRYDFTVVWKRLDSCASGLASMPRPLWRQVTSMITTFEAWDVPSTEQPPPPQMHAVTYFAVEDGGGTVR